MVKSRRNMKKNGINNEIKVRVGTIDGGRDSIFCDFVLTSFMDGPLSRSDLISVSISCNILDILSFVQFSIFKSKMNSNYSTQFSNKKKFNVQFNPEVP